MVLLQPALIAAGNSTCDCSRIIASACREQTVMSALRLIDAGHTHINFWIISACFTHETLHLSKVSTSHVEGI